MFALLRKEPGKSDFTKICLMRWRWGYLKPSHYANGFMSLTSDLKLILFSTSTLEESSTDDSANNPSTLFIKAVLEQNILIVLF